MKTFRCDVECAGEKALTTRDTKVHEGELGTLSITGHDFRSRTSNISRRAGRDASTASRQRCAWLDFTQHDSSKIL